MRHGFTLIEMLAVIALMAVLTATAAVSLSGASRAARIEDVVDQFIAIDRSAREVARRFATPVRLRFSLNDGTIRRIEAENDPVIHALPGGAKATRIRLPGDSRLAGEVEIAFSTRGQSPSYAVRLKGSAGERWVLFSGLTGQPVIFENEKDVENILSPTAASGPDAR